MYLDIEMTFFAHIDLMENIMSTIFKTLWVLLFIHATFDWSIKPFLLF